MIPATAANLDAAGVGIAHHFGGGAYIKETCIPAGCALAQHAHDHDHLSVLVSGEVVLTVDGVSTVHAGPKVLTIEKNKIHTVYAIQDSIWLCVWATKETDPQKVDESILKG